ncbi:MAG: chromate transporter, partial [Marinobacter sp. 34-60-7]
MTDTDPPASPWQIFLIFLRLGLTSFGGPAAHIGYFHDEFVKRRRWFSDSAYAEIVALCQLLPGPASSQTGLTIGLLRGKAAGAFAAWLGFTLPSAVVMAVFAFGLASWADAGASGWIDGLKLFVVAVVAQAVWQMGKSLCPDTPRVAMAIGVAVTLLMIGSTWAQILALVAAGSAGVWLRLPSQKASEELHVPLSSSRPMLFALAFAVLLALSLLPFAQGSLTWLAAE